MKIIYLLLLLFSANFCKAQKIDSIFVNLYTDSLKLGTYNYINIVGLTNEGNYIPLDTSHLKFKSSAGEFFGNNLFLDGDAKIEKVKFTVCLKDKPSKSCDFEIYIKKHEDNTPLPLERDVIKQKANKKS